MLEGGAVNKSNTIRALAVVLTGIVLISAFLAPFTYIVNGNHFEYRFDVKDIDKSYTVTYEGKKYDLDITIPGRLYYSYADQPRIVDKSTGKMDYAAYVVNDEVVQKIANELKRIANDEIGDSSDYTLASLILSFAHQTTYERDPSNKEGRETEYPRTPVETLVENGDCEDLAALFVSVSLAAGLDAVFFMFPAPVNGHMAAGVHLDNGHGLKPYYTSSSGEKYYFCDAVSSNVPVSNGVGYIPPNYAEGSKMYNLMEVLDEFPNA